jgi:hypothetical protein
MRRPVQKVSRRAAVMGYVGLVLVMSAGAATGLSGSNTVFSDDVVDGQVFARDIASSAISSAKVYDNSLTGADIRNGSVFARDIASNAISSTKVYDNSLTGADIRNGSVGRSDLSFAPISDVVQVGNKRSYAGFQFAGNIASCPNTHPVPLSGGYGVGSGADAGFALRASIPLQTGWLIYGQNTSSDPKDVIAYVICGSDGSSR